MVQDQVICRCFQGGPDDLTCASVPGIAQVHLATRQSAQKAGILLSGSSFETGPDGLFRTTTMACLTP